MKTGEVAKLLNVSSMTIRNWTNKGELKSEMRGTQRFFNMEDIMNFYFDKMENKLLQLMKYYQRVEEIREIIKKCKITIESTSEKRFSWQKSSEKTLIFLRDYAYLAEQQVIHFIVSIAGSSEGCLKKLVGLSSLSSKEKIIAYELVAEIGSLLMVVNNTSGVRKYRNSHEHDLVCDEVLFFQNITVVVEKIQQLFQLIKPNSLIVGEKWPRKIFNATDILDHMVFYIGDSHKFDELEHKLDMALCKEECSSFSKNHQTNEFIFVFKSGNKIIWSKNGVKEEV